MSQSVEENNLAINDLNAPADTVLSQQQLVEQAWNQQNPRKIAEDLNALMQAMVETPVP